MFLIKRVTDPRLTARICDSFGAPENGSFAYAATKGDEVLGTAVFFTAPGRLRDPRRRGHRPAARRGARRPGWRAPPLRRRCVRGPFRRSSGRGFRRSCASRSPSSAMRRGSLSRSRRSSRRRAAAAGGEFHGRHRYANTKTPRETAAFFLSETWKRTVNLLSKTAKNSLLFGMEKCILYCGYILTFSFFHLWKVNKCDRIPYFDPRRNGGRPSGRRASV